MSIGKKILVGLGIIILVIIFLGIGFLIYISLNSSDTKKIDDSALYPSSNILSREDNAFYDFKQTSDALVFPEDKSQAITDLANGTNWDDAVAIQIVNDNATTLAAFNQGSWKKGFQDPALQADIKTLNTDTALANLAGVRNLAKINSIRSLLLLKDGKENEAFDNSINTIYAGQIMENSPRINLLSYLMGMSVKGIGIANLQLLITDSHLNSNDLKNYITKIEKFKNNRVGLQEAFKTEYVFQNNTKEQMIDKYINVGTSNLSSDAMLSKPLSFPSSNTLLMKTGFYYKPNETQKLFIEKYQNFVDNAVKNCNELMPQPPKLELAKLSKTKLLLTENAVGKILADFMLVSFNSSFNNRCKEEFSIIKTQIALASKAYKNDNGDYPVSVDQLYPNYLSFNYGQFDGQNIVYDAITGTVSLSQ